MSDKAHNYYLTSNTELKTHINMNLSQMEVLKFNTFYNSIIKLSANFFLCQKKATTPDTWSWLVALYVTCKDWEGCDSSASTGSGIRARKAAWSFF